MQDYKSQAYCHICGKYEYLTYEHIPPEKAFNNRKVFIISGTELKKMIGLEQLPWDAVRDKTVDKIQKQRGIGWYTLCGKCNNITGKWYGDGFIDFVEQGYQYIEDIGGYSKLVSNSTVKLQFNSVFPLRFIKQIITMFFSINGHSFAQTHPELREFVLSRDSKLNTEMFALYMYLMNGSIARYVGMAGIMKMNTFSSPTTRFVTELSASPFGFALEIDPKYDPILQASNIISLANNYSYDDRVDIHLSTPILEGNSQYPLDFRTRKQVFDEYIKNKVKKLLEKKQT